MTDNLVYLTCELVTQTSLYLSYMPFVNGGGLFIKTTQVYPLGQLIQLSIQVKDEPDVFEIRGQVIWITPKGTQGNKPSGIGVQFLGEHASFLCHKIEKHLGSLLNSTQFTYTI